MSFKTIFLEMYRGAVKINYPDRIKLNNYGFGFNDV